MGRWRFMGVILLVLFISFGFYRKGWAEERYVVKPGDTLSVIAKSFGVSIDTLKKANRLVKDTIRDGQVLVIPTRSSNQQLAQAPLLQNPVSDSEERRQEPGAREEGDGRAAAENVK